MKLLCLLPVRNGERDLLGYFESAARFADAVIALDDGSDDGTRALLEREPLVVELLSNPVRHGYRGWHDAENRNRLLEAATAHRPDWIISVDADERIDEGDAAALRAFLNTDALPGLAYGFRCYSMAGDLEHALPNPIWVYRLFAWQPGQAFPDQQLHFAPIPTSIPRRAFLRTTFRIQHLGGMSAERRLARYEKYRQVDPECRYWPDYAGLLKEPAPDDVAAWEPRDPSWPAIFTGHVPSSRADVAGQTGGTTGHTGFSVVVLDGGAATGVLRALDSAESHANDGRFTEVIRVQRAGTSDGRGSARIVTVPPNVTPGVMRNAGLAAATGECLLFLDGDLSLLPGALDRLQAGFDLGFASVTGGIVDLSEGAASATFEDRFEALRAGRIETILERPVPWASYSKTLLIELGGFDESVPGGEDEELGRRVAAAGYVTFRLGEPVLAYHGESVASRLHGLRAAFARGRTEARHRLAAAADRGELLAASIRCPTLGRPGVGWDIRAARGAGKWTELLRPERGKAQVLVGRPGGIALVAVTGLDGGPWLALVRFDLTVPELRAVVLPPDLRVPAAGGGLTTLAEALFPAGAGHLDRFAVNDAIGRPLQVRIDDVVLIEGETELGEKLARTVEAAVSTGRDRAPGRFDRLRASAAAWGAVVRGSAVETSFGAVAAGLALLRLSRIAPDRIEVIRPFQDAAVLDGDGVDLVRSFLGIDEIVRPRTKRDSLREVEWA